LAHELAQGLVVTSLFEVGHYNGAGKIREHDSCRYSDDPANPSPTIPP
jgi:hypothetical protein